MWDVAYWFQPDTQGWWITIPTTAFLAAYLVWVRSQPSRQSYAPLLLVALTLVGVALHYARSNWHQHFGNHLLWLSGVVSIAVAAPLPPLFTILVDWASRRYVRTAVLRAVLATVLASLLTFGFQRALAFRAADLTFYVAKHVGPR